MSVVCLQGGGEFDPACAAMDRELVGRAGGPVVVAPLAALVGLDYRDEGARGVAYYRGLGATAECAPDARADLPAALSALRSGGLLAFPDGDPGRLRTALSGAVAEVVRERAEGGAVVCGSGAGAMLLCDWAPLAEEHGGLVRGLGLVPGVLLLPFYGTASTGAGHEPPAGTVRVGVPRHSGLLVDGGRWFSVGVGGSVVLDGPEAGPVPRREAA